MNALIALALKSLVIGAVTLLLLRLARGRSAAERSWVAHVGLLAMVVLPFAPLAMPALQIELPSAVSSATDPASPAPVAAQGAAEPAVSTKVAAAQPADTRANAGPVIDLDTASLLYWIPTGILLGITLLSLMRLFALRARADVLVDGHWLSALARAQKRMGFKHGTALLTSGDLPSPISWGLMRPVILLNTRAVDAADEAEAIIAHELAHVARLDWLKLLLARVATALFWFNPMAWMLAREAHQLREEAADDTVLAADIPDTDYAQLLVGIARHECKGMLIGAHGVAPSKSSLARRVKRVLDSGLPRDPAARPFLLGVFVGMLALAAPLAALTIVPAGSGATNGKGKKVAFADEDKGYYPAGGVALPHVVRQSVDKAVSSAVQGALSVVQPPEPPAPPIPPAVAQRMDARGAWSGIGPRPGEVGPKPGDVGPVTRQPRDEHSAIDTAIEMRAVGVTPDYVANMRTAAPNIGRLSNEDLIELRAVGVTPAYVQELANAGYRSLDKDALVQARAMGIRGSYIASLAAEGYPNLSIDELVEMKAVGVRAEDIRALRRQGYPRFTPKQLVDMKAVGGSDISHGRRGRGADPDPDPDPDDDTG
ncbi:M56 family metallopeptidase [Sphingobium nicotianae]|uniref:Peptidase M56 domain-containing protein n=1 Tax=Sphingobium nicotianae TaxID=2782607 RepID=A0A9X1IRE1_9SPHN|nr:M56 family metallopeptidase [Sphingobium nicotianae]MBT2187302.1 hypothetical protein [Sphingobium nicotianae]